VERALGYDAVVDIVRREKRMELTERDWKRLVKRKYNLEIY
jgi:hypothetical protein